MWSDYNCSNQTVAIIRQGQGDCYTGLCLEIKRLQPQVLKPLTFCHPNT